MPVNINTVTVAGSLTRDPESRQAGQSTVCKFGIAINRKIQGQGRNCISELRGMGQDR